jgi:hypothetical protein
LHHIGGESTRHNADFRVEEHIDLRPDIVVGEDVHNTTIPTGQSHHRVNEPCATNADINLRLACATIDSRATFDIDGSHPPSKSLTCVAI